MSPSTAVRPATAADREGVRALALDNGMFGPDEMDGFDAMFDGSLDGSLEGHSWVVLEAPAGGGPLGAAYVAPEPFADRVWNLLFLAVRPDGHGSGAGRTLIEHVERRLRDAGEGAARVLVVETSGTEPYAGSRAFYAARGFVEEARIREWYGPGDDKVVFWKSLTTS